MIVPSKYENAGFSVLNSTYDFPICREGNIPQAQVNEEYPILKGFGLDPQYERCSSRKYTTLVKANTGDGGSFFSKTAA